MARTGISLSLRSRVRLLAAALVVALPITGHGGDLEPPGPPAPTMRTLDEVIGAWSRSLDSTNGDGSGCDSSRFRCVLGGDAVLDLETGLVWQRDFQPSGVPIALSHRLCGHLRLGGAGGFRLPTLGELMSVLVAADPASPPAENTVLLPAGHPFTGNFDTGLRIWTSTLAPVTGTTEEHFYAFRSRYNAADEELIEYQSNSLGVAGPWCVRGPTPH